MLDLGKMVGFVRGLTYPARGLLFALRHRELLRYFPGPLLLGLLVLAGELALLAWGIRHFFPHAGPLRIALLWLGGIAAAALVLLALQSILSAPFCERLSERTEGWVTGTEPARAGFRGQALAFVHALVRGVLYLVLVAPVVVAGFFVPGLGLVSLLLTSAYAALEYLDYPTSRRRFSFSRKLALVGGHKAETLGFGLATSLLAGVPLLGLLVAPLAAIGGTLLFFDLCSTSERRSDKLPPHEKSALRDG